MPCGYADDLAHDAHGGRMNYQETIQKLVTALRECANADWQIPVEVLEAQCRALELLQELGFERADLDCD